MTETPIPSRPREDNKIFITVMGVTGSGKSSFIRALTGKDDVKVGHSLESETQDVAEYVCHYKGKTLVLVDTPGFSDTYRSKEEIVKKILDWLTTSKYLSGIIYLHRIVDPRMQGSAVSNLRMFQKLCGDEAFRNVVLVTSFWDVIDKSVGEAREAELRNKDEFWAKMVRKGSQIKRYNRNDPTSAEQILQTFETFSPRMLKAQKEILLEKKDPRQTDAAAFARLAEMQDIAKEKRQQAEKEKEKIAKQAEEDQARRRAAHLRGLKDAEEARECGRKYQQDIEAQEEALRARELQIYKDRLRLETERQEEQARYLAAAKRAEQERMERERKAMLRRHYETYICTGQAVFDCGKCGGSVALYPYYYHCCFCVSRGFDNYAQCYNCGICCTGTEHPLMEKREYWSDVVIEPRKMLRPLNIFNERFWDSLNDSSDDPVGCSAM